VTSSCIATYTGPLELSLVSHCAVALANNSQLIRDLGHYKGIVIAVPTRDDDAHTMSAVYTLSAGNLKAKSACQWQCFAKFGSKPDILPISDVCQVIFPAISGESGSAAVQHCADHVNCEGGVCLIPDMYTFLVSTHADNAWISGGNVWCPAQVGLHICDARSHRGRTTVQSWHLINCYPGFCEV
jgi:hypothetical protein